MINQREDFEEAAARMGYNLKMAEHETGEYHYPVTQDAWDMWQECCDKARESEPRKIDSYELLDRLNGALRQYRHNSDDYPGFVFGYDKHEIDGLIADLIAARESEGGEAVAWLLLFESNQVHEVAYSKEARNKWLSRSGRKAVPLYTRPQATPQPDKWIPCSERFPTYHDADCFGNVWVSDKAFREPKFAQAIKPWDQVGKVSDYTHWMPTGLTRPNPPEQESE